MRLAALFAGALLAACSPGQKDPPLVQEPVAEEVETAGPMFVNGNAFWPNKVELPNSAELIMEVYAPKAESDEYGAPAPLHVRRFPIEPGKSRAAFRLVVDPPSSEVDTLNLKAKVQSGYEILLSSDEVRTVPWAGGIDDVDIELFNPEDLPRGIPREMITPAGTAYVCGGEPVTIALKAGAAHVTFGDGTSVKLDLQEPALPPLQRFTNGRFLVEVRQGELGPPLTYFGRGRAMPIVCNREG